MKQLRAWLVRLAGLLPRNRRERELTDELEAHLQLHMDDNVRAGMTPEQARREALLKLGGMESTKEAYRDRGTILLLDHLLRDVRFAVRQLRKNPGFAATAVLTLALGIGASVAIFAFVDATLIKLLPYRDSARLVGVFEHTDLCPQCNLSYPDYLDWKRLNKVFKSLDAYARSGYIVNTPEGAVPETAARVTDGFFRTLGVVPALGRDFYAGEDLPSAPRTVLISYASWQTRYGGRKDVVGQTIVLSGVPNVIIGVLPKDFHFAPAEPAEIWSAFNPSTECDRRRSCFGDYGIARLKDGVSVEAALANTALIAHQLEVQYPDSNRGQGANVLPLSEVIVGNVRPMLLTLLAGAGLLLLIATVNVSSLLLVRSEGRRKEIAVRGALGASRPRLISQFVAEGLVLVSAGSLVGVLFAHWAMQLLVGLIPAAMLDSATYLRGLGLNLRVLGFAVAIALLEAAVYAMTPVVHLSFTRMKDGLADGSRGSAGNAWRRVGSKLVVVELALAMVLLVSAGLLGRSFYRLMQVGMGFQPDHLATLTLSVPVETYKNDSRKIALLRKIVQETTSLPGVQSAGFTSVLPVSGNGNTTWIRIAGKPFHGEHNEVNEREVSADYFHTLRARLVRGRVFSDAEDESKPRVIVINQALARQYFPGENPIGRQIGDMAMSPKSVCEVIGVVEDVRESTMDTDTWPAVYYPMNQGPDTFLALVVRTGQSERSLLPALVNSIHRVDPGIATIGPATMDDLIKDSFTTYLHRSAAQLVGGFAALALLLGVVGLYGVVAHSVSQRTREIGVRMALGAERGMVYRLVLKEAGWLAAIGIGAGLACALGVASTLRGLLFGIPSWDVPTLAAVSTMLAVAAMLASFIPARRAASVSPVEALRSE